MNPDVKGQINSDLFRALLEGASMNKEVPITVHKSATQDEVPLVRRRLNIAILTEQLDIPEDAEEVYRDIAYKHRGNIFCMENVDDLFIGSTVRLAELFFKPIEAMIDGVPVMEPQSILEEFMFSLDDNIQEGVQLAEKQVQEQEAELEDARDVAAAKERMLLNTQEYKRQIELKQEQIRQTNWNDQTEFLNGLCPNIYEEFRFEDGKLIGITNEYILEGPVVIERDRDGVAVDWGNEVINFGQFAIEMSVEEEGLRVLCKPHANNIWDRETEEYLHPHVSEEFKVCMGDQHAAFEEAVGILDVMAIFNLTHQILSEYSDENPHKAFEYFWEE